MPARLWTRLFQFLRKKGDGFVKAMWCGDEACEDIVKRKRQVLVQDAFRLSRRIFQIAYVCCGKPAKAMVYWGKAY